MKLLLTDKLGYVIFMPQYDLLDFSLHFHAKDFWEDVSEP